MNGQEFRALLGRAGLRQVDVARAVEAVSGGMAGPDKTTVNRYVRERLAVPASLVAFLELWCRLPKAAREQFLPPK